MQNPRQVILMCDKKGCCPTVTLDKERVLIEDDFGGKVKLTKDQFEVFKNKVKEGEL